MNPLKASIEIKKKIAVLFGGCSTEYEISLQSAYAVLGSINRERYEVCPVGITRQGKWYLYQGPAVKLPDNTWEQDDACVPCILSPDRSVHGLMVLSSDQCLPIRIDAVFPVLHGKNGEDGTVQGLAELAGIPIIGCGTLASALCMDKDLAHTVVKTAGIDVPDSFVLHGRADMTDALSWAAGRKLPLFIKPSRSGSSIGITRVTDTAGLEEAVELAFTYDSKVLIEEGIEGNEVGCAVMGGQELILGETDEIELQNNVFFGFEEKYHTQTAVTHMPGRYSRETADRIRRTAAIAYRALDCSGFARVDLFLTPQGRIVFNEVNTIPGFTAHSRFPGMMKGIGLSFEDIIEELIAAAVSGI